MLLDADGKPLDEGERHWMTCALIDWLGDERTQVVCLRQRLFTYEQLQDIRQGLAQSMIESRPIKMDSLRRAIVAILSNRVARIRIAAQILRREYEDRMGYEIMCRNFPRVLDLWAKERLRGKDVGPQPQDPCDDPPEKVPPPPRGRGEVMRELLQMRDELGAQ